jgi:dihydrolipoamide dehydrogenase
MMKHKVVGGSGGASGCKVNVEDVGGSGEKKTIECDVILVSTGRRAFTQGLGLDKIGVKTDKAGRVEINERL